MRQKTAKPLTSLKIVHIHKAGNEAIEEAENSPLIRDTPGKCPFGKLVEKK